MSRLGWQNNQDWLEQIWMEVEEIIIPDRDGSFTYTEYTMFYHD